MDKWVTVLTTILPQQLWIIRGRLEAEGIECFIKDELTVQSYNLYSNAVGGVKLQVLEKDQQRAVEILIELGYLKNEPVSPDFLTLVDRRTSNFFLLKNLGIKARLIVLTLLASSLLGTILYLIFRPSTYDMLTDTAWCVSKISFKGQFIKPNTQQTLILAFVDGNGNRINCETLSLMRGNTISLPGINSDGAEGFWKYNSNETIFINVDNLKEIYNGTYKVDVSYNRLILNRELL